MGGVSTSANFVSLGMRDFFQVDEGEEHRHDGDDSYLSNDGPPFPPKSASRPSRAFSKGSATDFSTW